MKKILFLTLVVSIISSCSVNKKHVIWTKTYSFNTSIIEDDMGSKIRYQYYSDSLEADNAINYNSRDEVLLMDFNTNTPDLKTAFGMMWDSKEFLLSELRPGDYYTREDITDEGHLFINHSGYDANGVSMHVIYDGAEDNFYNTVYSGDSIRIEREVELSQDVIYYYKKLRINLMDSLTFHREVEFPDMTNCTKLIWSTYKKTECLSFNEGLYRETVIDSSYEDGELEVDKEEKLYTHLKTYDNEGNLTEIYSDNQMYIEKCFLASDLQNPLTATHSYYNQEDTLYTIKMSTHLKRGLRQSKFMINENIYEYGNFRLPIISRVVNVWRNKKGEIVRVQNLATTNEGHVLELDKKNGKVVTEKLTIPEISGDQIYPIGFDILYRLKIYWYHNKVNESNTKKSVKPLYSDYIEELKKKYDKDYADKSKKKEVWTSKDSSDRIELWYE